MRIISAFFVLVWLSFSAFAQLDGNPENWCRNGAFPRESENYRLGEIKGKKGERIYFYGDENDCPNGKNCRRKSYLIPNDEAIVSRTFGNFSCIWFQPKKGSETVGWIPSENIEYLPEKEKTNLSDWLGDWRFYDNSIEIIISDQRGLLGVTGNAIWKGLGDNVHIGELEEKVAPSGNVLKIGENDTDEYACKATLRLLGSYLIVSDNLNCGGANVTFSGVYRKTQTK